MDVHLLRVELVVVLAVFLRAVHCDVGVLHQRQLVLRLGGEHADADARGHPALLPAYDHGLIGSRENFARNRLDLLGLAHLLYQHDEFVPAEPRHHVAPAHRLGEALGHLLQ